MCICAYMFSTHNSSCLFVRRKRSSGKSGCFSPKTSKRGAGVRHSFRGFLRRLSGGKSHQVASAALFLLADWLPTGYPLVFRLFGAFLSFFGPQWQLVAPMGWNFACRSGQRSTPTCQIYPHQFPGVGVGSRNVNFTKCWNINASQGHTLRDFIQNLHGSWVVPLYLRICLRGSSTP